ncbi:hypothetical protein Taro_026470, partial [Colocasia esculenta]|nr:hypothetical protein [Colocasia esculenta]
VEVILCVVHIIAKLSTGDAGSLSLSLVHKLLTISKKLRDQPAFSALLQKYSVHGYRAEELLASASLNVCWSLASRWLNAYSISYFMRARLSGRDFLLKSSVDTCILAV